MERWISWCKGGLGLCGTALFIGLAAGFLAGPVRSEQPAPHPQGPRSELQEPPDGSKAKEFGSLPDAPASAYGCGAEPAPVPPPSAAPEHAPPYNYALSSHGARATGGQRPELLIDGKTSGYDGGNGFACTEWNANPPQPMVVLLQEAVQLNAVRFLLWDGDPRYYRYKLEASPDLEGERWSVLADRRSEAHQCRGWQLISFPARTLRRLRLVGTFNSVNSGFHVVELEAYQVPGGLSRAWDAEEF